MQLKILYVDMDNVLVDFSTVIARVEKELLEKHKDNYDDIPGIFALMDPVEGAIEAVHELSRKYDLYILSTAPWKNPTAWIDKVKWIQKHFGAGKESILYKRLIISHHKNLNKGHYLIDDREANGAKDFEGEWIQFKTDKFPNWKAVLAYLSN